jgi:serine/threonine protein kinase
LEELQGDDPRQIGRYVLLGRLGAGGMGQVFLGRSPGGRLVAVKIIHPELARDHKFRVRFAREVEAARRVSGAFTAPVIDADPDARLPWLATSYVNGPSLADAVNDYGPLPLSSVLALAAGLAEGLGAVHEAGVIHRDLKPSNVLLAQDGPRLIDFGISQAADSSQLTLTGVVIGTPGFMSPEQALGDPVGPSGDIFGLGAVLAFAATGEGPYGDGSPAARQFRLLTLPPRLENVPAKLRPLLARCMSRDAAARPTAAEFLTDLIAAHPSAASQTAWLPASILTAMASSPWSSAPSPSVPADVSDLAPTLPAPDSLRSPSASPAPAGQPGWEPTLTAAASRPPAKIAEPLSQPARTRPAVQKRELREGTLPQKSRRARLIFTAVLAVTLIGTAVGLAVSLPGHSTEAVESLKVSTPALQPSAAPSAAVTVTTPSQPPQHSIKPAMGIAAGWSYGLTASQAGALTTQHHIRITQVRVMDPSVPTFAVTTVSNSGSSASGWWWYFGQTPSQVNSLLARNHAELTSVDPYQTTAGLRFAVVMMPSTGAQVQTWWYDGVNAATIGQLLKRDNARLTALRPYVKDGHTVFAVIMVSNATAGYTPWEYLCGASISTIVSRLKSQPMRVDAVVPDPTGGWDAILVADMGEEWYWWFGISAQAVQTNVASHGTQLIDLSPYYVDGQLKFASVELKTNLLDNLNATRR